MKYHVNQVVQLNDDLIYNNEGVVMAYKGTKFVVNDIGVVHCNCKTNNEWRLYSIGIMSRTVTGYKCKHCGKTIVHEIRAWVPEKYFDEVKNDVEELGKMEAQVFLLHLLADQKIPASTYHKIMEYLHGDDEMIELGKQLLKNYT